MKINNKIILFVATVSVIATISSYAINFGFTFSDNHQRWGEFGAYLAGTLGTFLSLASILYVFHSNNQQIKENKRQSNIENYVDQANRILDSLQSIDNKIISPHVYITNIIEHQSWGKDHVEIRENEKGNTVEIANITKDLSLHFSTTSPIEIINTYLGYLEYANSPNKIAITKAWIEKDWQIKGKLIKYRALTGHLVKIVTQLLDHNYDLYLAQQMLTNTYSQIIILNKIDYADKKIFNILGLLLSIPDKGMKFNPKELVSNLVEDLNKSLNLCYQENELKFVTSKRVSNSTGLHEITLQHIKTQNIYVRSVSGEWKEI
ncbi:hypothetical protein [Pelagibaculum spongiae]|uniref:hypothetical protein n=1 Tax=Pelagibaculum spongiae TaxID=2080658 RepID=UPI0010582D7B|nr:hypothetical protein [Pelagibaculum spongiae]